MAPFVLRIKKTEGPSRLTVIVSTKIDKRATKRNRMRRLIRESLRHVSPTGIAGTCIVRKNFAESSQKEIETILKNLLHEKITA